MSLDRQVARSLAWITLFLVAGKAAGIAKEIAIAYRYGASATVDAYLFAFTLANWPTTIWISILIAVFVPIVLDVKRTRMSDAFVFNRELFGLTVTAGLLIGSLFWSGMPYRIAASWTGFSDEGLRLVEHFGRPLSWMIPLGFVGGYFAARLISERRHWNTLFEGIPALTLFLSLLIFSTQQYEPLIWGTVAGVFLQIAALAGVQANRSELWPPRLTFNSNVWGSFLASLGAVAAGQIILSATSIVDQFFASHLREGSVATLGYSTRLVALILTLGATATSRALLPILASTTDTRRSFQLGIRWGAAAFAVGVAVALVVWVLSRWIVEVVFQRGAFSEDDSTAVSAVLRASLIQVPFYFSGIVFVQYFAAQRRFRVLLLGSILAFVVKLIGNILFVDSLGLEGLMVATALMYLANLLLFSVALKVTRKEHQ